MDHLSLFPLPFFLSFGLALILAWFAWEGRRDGWGLPTAMVLATVVVWYHGDGIYNDYPGYQAEMGNEALVAGWWQVFWFLCVFGFLVKPVNRYFNQRFLRYRSRVVLYYETNLLQAAETQRKIDKVAKLLLFAWILLMAIALWRLKFNFIALFAPYLGEKMNPWSRGRIGGGFSAVLSLAGYVQILLTASFGVFAAVARNPSTRVMALTVCALALPFYFLDRTRNTMIAVMLPGLLSWVFFRLKIGMLGKGAVLLGSFMALNFWFSFVLANRNDGSISSQLGSKEALENAEDVHHGGLTMFSELGYMNYYFEKGTLKPNWGRRYFAEIVNPIPRGLWAGKPSVGLDYAVARGFASRDTSAGKGGVTASIATGMIGQGIVNFGVFFGPMAAAFLMSLWVAVLARQDLLGQDPARMLLYAVGMILTFNMGRDITLLVLYPFVFGWLGLHAAIKSGFYFAAAPMVPQRRRMEGGRRPTPRPGRQEASRPRTPNSQNS